MDWRNRDFRREAQQEHEEHQYHEFLEFIRGQGVSPQELPDEAVDQWFQSEGELVGTIRIPGEDTPEKRKAKIEELHRQWKESKQK